MAWIWNQFTREKQEIYNIIYYPDSDSYYIMLKTNRLDEHYELIVYHNATKFPNPYYDYGIKCYKLERYNKCCEFQTNFIKGLKEETLKRSSFLFFDVNKVIEVWIDYPTLLEKLEKYKNSPFKWTI